MKKNVVNYCYNKKIMTKYLTAKIKKLSHKISQIKYVKVYMSKRTYKCDIKKLIRINQTNLLMYLNEVSKTIESDLITLIQKIQASIKKLNDEGIDKYFISLSDIEKMKMTRLTSNKADNNEIENETDIGDEETMNSEVDIEKIY